MAVLDQRTHMAAIMQYLISKEPQILYAQIRPMLNIQLFEQDLVHALGAGHTLSMDCSEAVTCICKWGGLHDPNGLAYNGKGNTDTMYANLPHYTQASHAHTGAIVIFGANPTHHAAMVLEQGTDPLLFSHGTDAGPVAIRLSSLAPALPAPVTFLDIGSL